MKNLILGLMILTLLTSAAMADVPDKFTNLKVFPEDIGKRELVAAMRSFSMALGMRCIGCHEIKTPGDYDTIDWASDKLPNKEVARGMMKMTQEINGNLLPAATGEHDFSVRCVTCHRGVDNPRTLDNVLLKVIGKDGVEAGANKYRELRENYYGSGSYDFTPMTLTTVAETLAQESADMGGARLMVNLNLEMNPDHADSYLMLAEVDLAGGNKEAARANIDKALALDPQNGHAQRMLKQFEQ
jgi:hypothetical protein